MKYFSLTQILLWKQIISIHRIQFQILFSSYEGGGDSFDEHYPEQQNPRGQNMWLVNPSVEHKKRESPFP